MKLVKIALFLVVLLISSALIFTDSTQAQSAATYDYVILMDTSESMMWVGDPPIFEQLQDVVSTFVESLQDRSNVAVYTFDSEIKEIGSWTDLNDSKKMEIIKALSELKAEGQSTKLWDAVCEGVQDLESRQSGLPGGNQFQMLISFTDGLDNASKNDKETCVGNFIDLYDEEGHILWIYNAIGVQVPEIIRDNEGPIKIVESNAPEPIRVTYLTPMTLRLGNLYETGIADSEITCFVPWYSDDSMLNRVVSIDRPYPADGEAGLPSFAFEVCGPGAGDCPKEFKISEGRICLEISLVNSKPEFVKPDEGGEHVYNLPVNLEKGLGESMFLIPDAVRLEFSLNSPTPTNTFTPTWTPSPTPEPSITPVPIPAALILSCEGLTEVDLGTLPKPGLQDATRASISCDLSWPDREESDPYQLTLLIDSAEGEYILTPGKEVWLDSGDGPAKSLMVGSEVESVSFGVTLPAIIWEEMGQRSADFRGRILLERQAQNTEGASPEEGFVEWRFNIKNPPPKWPWAAGGGLLVFLILLATRPRFPETSGLSTGLYDNLILRDFKPSSWWSGKVYLGGGPRGYLKLGDEEEDLLSIQPSFQGSWIGRMMSGEEDISYQLKPLNDARVDVVGAQPISAGEKVDIYHQKFYVLYKNEKHVLEIKEIEGDGFDESGPGDTKSEDLENFFGI